LSRKLVTFWQQPGQRPCARAWLIAFQNYAEKAFAVMAAVLLFATAGRRQDVFWTLNDESSVVKICDSGNYAKHARSWSQNSRNRDIRVRDAVSTFYFLRLLGELRLDASIFVLRPQRPAFDYREQRLMKQRSNARVPEGRSFPPSLDFFRLYRCMGLFHRLTPYASLAFTST